MSGLERCGYAVIDLDGDEQPCDRPASGWRWYQDCGHEDTLEVACAWHENEGGRRMANLSVLVGKLAADLAKADPHHFSIGLMVGRVKELRAALDGDA